MKKIYELKAILLTSTIGELKQNTLANTFSNVSEMRNFLEFHNLEIVKVYRDRGLVALASSELIHEIYGEENLLSMLN